MKVFMTGATGFVGSWVAEKLIEKGGEVTCLVRRSSNLKWIQHLPLKHHYGSLSDSDSLKEGAKNADYILHIGGVTKALKVEEYYRGNVQATENLLEAVLAVNPNLKKFVHLSSQAAVGPSESLTPIDETHPCRPLTDYGKSKLQTEQIVRQYFDKLPVTILRPPTVYGPRDTDVFEAFRNVKYGINLKIGKAEQYVSLIHVFDLAEAIVHTAQSDKGCGETYFVCNDQPYPWSEIVGLIKDIMGKRTIDLSVPYAVAYGIASFTEAAAKLRGKATILNRQKMQEIRQPYWTVSNQKMKAQLKFSPQLSLQQGIRITLEWYRQNGWL